MGFNFEDVLNQDSTIPVTDRSISKDTSLIDADTAYDNTTGKSIRIEGVDTLETSKNREGQFFAGDVGGQFTSDVARELAVKGGYTQPIITSEDETYGRAVGDLINPATGERYSTKLLQSGLGNVTTFSDEGQVSAAIGGRLDRLTRQARGEQDEWDVAKDQLSAIIGASGPVAKPLAIDEQQYTIAPDIFSKTGTQIRDTGRTIDNKYAGSAIGKLKTAFGLGFSGAVEGYYGSFDLFADIFGQDNNWGQANAERIQREIQDLPILENQSAFDKDGNWTLDSAGKVVDFVFTNMATSAPYMIQSIIATALAAPTFGASLALPALTYTGQTYNEQGDDRDATSAIISGIGQSALDYFGIRIPGAYLGAKNFLRDPKAKTAVVNELAKKLGSKKKAEAALANYSTRQIAALSKAAKDQLGKQIRAKYVGKRAAIAAGVGGLSEGVTEVGQEFLAALGAKKFDIGELDKQELTNRLLNAAVAGIGLGAVTNVGSPVGSYISSVDAVRAANSPRADKFSKDYKHREDLAKEGKGYDNLDTYLDEAHADIAAGKKGPDLKKLSKKERRRRDSRGFFEKVKDLADGGINQFWEGWSKNLNRKYGERGRYSRALFGLVNGNNVHHGGDLETDQHLAESNLANTVGTEASALEFFGARKLSEISDIYNDISVQDFIAKVTNKFDANPGKYNSYIEAARAGGITLDGKYANISDKVLTFGQKLDANDELVSRYTGKPKEVGGLANSKVIDKQILRKQQREFIEGAVKAGLTREQATALSNDLLDLPNLSTLDDVNDPFLRLKPLGTSNKTLSDIQNDPNMQKFFNNDLFYKLAARNSATAAKAVNARYAGKDGEVFAHFINKAVENGEISRKEAGHLAAEFQDILDVRSGEYKKIESPTWRAINNELLFWSTLNALPLAQTASIVELALTTRTVSKQGIFGVLGKFAKESARELQNTINLAGSRVTGGRVQRKAYETGGREHLVQLGFTSESQSQTRRHDISVDESRQKWLNAFFTATGLKGITDITRSLRLSLAGDAIRGWIDDVSFEAQTGPTEASVEAREALINLGVDVDFMVNQHKSGAPMTPAEKAHFESNLQRAMYAFTNDAVANPTKTNRPKFYQNPRTRLFFQFQGFLATLTANILPKLYKQVATGTLKTQLNAVSTIGTLLFLGFLSSHLKDLIKYGEETPYLDDWGKFQRAVGASGLLGTGERLLNFASPLYPQQHDNWVELALEELQGQAPALGYAGKVVDLAGSIYEGDAGTIGKKAVKASPGLGPFNQVANAVEDLLE